MTILLPYSIPFVEDDEKRLKRKKTRIMNYELVLRYASTLRSAS